jgi:hypothetical protein
VAILFGLLTIFAGSRVLMGVDPGYVVFRPLLVYNTIMGFVYVAAGLVIWRNTGAGMYSALAILVLNLMVLGGIFYLYQQGSPVAADSLRAMSVRTGVWLAISGVLIWLNAHGRRSAGC